MKITGADAKWFIKIMVEFDQCISHLEPQRLGSAVLNFMHDQLGVEHVSIVVLGKEKDRFRIYESAPVIERIMPGGFLPFSSTILTQVIRRTKPLYRRDIRKTKTVYEVDKILLNAGFRSDFLIPLIVENHCLGTLNNAATRVDGLSLEKRKLLEVLAPRLAQALRNALLVEDLDEKHRNIESIFSSINEALFIVEPSTRIIKDCNPAVKQMFGYSLEDVIGKNTEFLHIDRLMYEKFGEELFPALDSAGVYRTEFKMRRKNGEIFPTEHSVTQILDESGHRIAVVSVVRDITEKTRKEQILIRAKEAFQESEHFLRRVLDINPNIMFIVDENERIILSNQAFADFYGTTVDEINGMTHKELHIGKKMSPEELAGWFIDNRRTLEGGKLINLIEYGHNHAGEGAWYRTRKLPIRLIDGTRAVLVLSENINEIKQNEELLKKKEADLSRAQRVAHMGNWEWNVQSNRVDWSDETFRIFGLEPQDLSFQVIKSLIYPADVDLWEKSVNEAIYDKQPFCIDHRAVRPDGSVCWLHNEAEVVRDEKGNPLKMFGTAQDITEHKRAEETLRKSEEKHRLLFETMLHGVIYHDSNGKIIEANPAAEEILGLDADEITSRTTIDPQWQVIKEDGSKFPEETRPSWVALKTGKPVKNVVMGVFNPKENKYRWIIINAIPLFRQGETEPFQVHTTFTDITARKETEEKLLEETRQKEEALALLDSLFESAPIGLAFCDTDLRFVRLNKALAEINGLPVQDHVGKKVDDFLPKIEGIQDVAKQWRRIIQTGKPMLNVEISGETHSCPGLRRHWVENWYPVRVGGQIIGIAATVMDITERKVAEEELRYYIERLKIINYIDRAILAVQSPEDICRVALSHVSKQIPFMRASVVRFNLESGEARVFVVDMDGKISLGPGAIIPLEIFGDMEEFKQGRINIVEDIQTLSHLSQFTQALMMEGVRSYMNIPLISKSKLMGSLNIGFANPGKFEEKYLDIVREVADSLAIAIQNAQLMDEISRHRESLQRLSTRLIDAQEVERKRISMELHDEMGQTLTAISINLAAIEKNMPPNIAPELKEKLDDTRLLADQTSDQIRELSFYLRPSLLDDLGLVPSLRWFIENYAKRSNIEVDFKTIGLDERLKSPIEIAAYRVLQEALNNVVKHAEATKVIVRLERRKNAIFAFIEDNGKGFDVREVKDDDERKYGIGLMGMRERLRVLKGNLHIESRKSHGTRISLDIPLEEKQKS